MGKKTKKNFNQELTKHHILPNSKWWNLETDNINRIWRIVHQSIHNIFANKTPVEQLKHLMLDINTTALTEWFKNDIELILSETDSLYYYKEWIFRPHYLNNKRRNGISN